MGAGGFKSRFRRFACKWYGKLDAVLIHFYTLVSFAMQPRSGEVIARSF